MAEQDRFGLVDAIELVGTAIGLAGTVAARRATATARVVKEVVEKAPSIAKGNAAIKEAKADEKALAAILEKPNPTKADVKKAENLAKDIRQNLDVARENGAATGPKSTVTAVEKSVTEKLTKIREETGVKPPKDVVSGPEAAKAKAEAEAAARAKTPTKKEEPTPPPAAKTKVTKKESDEAIAKAKLAEADEAARIKTQRAATTIKVGGATAAGASVADNAPTPKPTPIPPNIQIPDLTPPPGGDVTPPPGGDKTPPPGGDKNPPPGGKGDKPGSGGFDSGPNFDDGGTTPPPAEEPPAEQPPAEEPPVVEEPGNELWWRILQAKLLAAGMPRSTINKSYNYFKTLVTDFGSKPDGLDIVVDQFFYLKDYKGIESPYYSDFGKFNEKLARPKLPKDLVPLVLGYKDLAQNKYKISEKFYNDDAISKYLANDVSIAEFDDRLNTAALKSVTADVSYKSALKQLGYISEDSQLMDFFLDPNIGTMEMQNRQKNAAFVTEAVRRVSPSTQLEVDLEFAKQQAARYSAQGYTEAQISTLAATGFENVAEALPTTTKLAGIYDRPTAIQAKTLSKDIQSELQQEEFLNLASARRKRLKAQEEAAFSGASGMARMRSSTAGII